MAKKKKKRVSATEKRLNRMQGEIDGLSKEMAALADFVSVALASVAFTTYRLSSDEQAAKDQAVARVLGVLIRVIDARPRHSDLLEKLAEELRSGSLLLN